MTSVPAFAIFDLDGTLSDSQRGILASFRATLDELGLTPSDDRLTSLIGPPLEDSFAQLGIAAEELDRVVARYREFYDESGVQKCELYDGVRTMLDGLRRDGVRMGVATSKRVDFANRMLVSLGIDEYFETVSGASLDGALSLKDDIVAQVLSFFQPSQPRKVWMVGDRRYDVLAAQRFGLVSLGVLWGYGTREELVGCGADILVGDPRELLELLEDDEGGDPVCWSHLVCPTCGVVRGGEHRRDECTAS